MTELTGMQVLIQAPPVSDRITSRTFGIFDPLPFYPPYAIVSRNYSPPANLNDVINELVATQA